MSPAMQRWGERAWGALLSRPVARRDTLEVDGPQRACGRRDLGALRRSGPVCTTGSLAFASLASWAEVS